MLTQHWVASLFLLIAAVFGLLVLRNRRGPARNPVAARAWLRTALIFLLISAFLWFWR